MLVLVTSEKTLGLNLGGSATGELLVEVDDTLHADGIGGSANSLELVRMLAGVLPVFQIVMKSDSRFPVGADIAGLFRRVARSCGLRDILRSRRYGN